jgi:hypothetical protein
MGQGEAVAVTQVGDDPSRHRFLSGTEVHLARNQTAVPQILDRELVAPSTQHLTI